MSELIQNIKNNANDYLIDHRYLQILQIRVGKIIVGQPGI